MTPTTTTAATTTTTIPEPSSTQQQQKHHERLLFEMLSDPLQWATLNTNTFDNNVNDNVDIRILLSSLRRRAIHWLNAGTGGNGNDNNNNNNNNSNSNSNNLGISYDGSTNGKSVGDNGNGSSSGACRVDCGRFGGVIDVAGGSGYVSMALGLAGIRSTLIDPRKNAGKLPKRERKIYGKAFKQQQQQQQKYIDSNNNSSSKKEDRDDNDDDDDISTNKNFYCQFISPPPPAPQQYNTHRAWFGCPPPSGVDTDFRHPDISSSSNDETTTQTTVMMPICSVNDHIVQNCNAIVALHPDEATDNIVDVAIQLQKPFLIVPCCIFYRLFPHRKITPTGTTTATTNSNVIIHDTDDVDDNNNNIDNDDDNTRTIAKTETKTTITTTTTKPVSTYDDLIQYLMSKHDTIQCTTIPFIGGKNKILYSTFS